MASVYERAVRCLSGPPPQRDSEEIDNLEPWLRKKSKLFSSLKKETIQDVIKHCEFITKDRHDVIIHQGERGYNFYIVLRGSVSIIIKENFDETEAELESQWETDRTRMGTVVSTLGDGATFGELALLNEDCIRTASVVADEPTDLVIIRRDLYNRSVAKVVKQDYDDKFNFIETYPMFHGWAQKWKKHLAIAMTKATYNYEDHVTRQGDTADRLYFITRGEVKLIADPEAHRHQFAEFMEQCASLLDDGRVTSLPRLAKKETPLAVKLRRLLDEQREVRNPPSNLVATTLTPSVIRKQMLFHRHHEKINICYLAAGKVIGDVEFLLNIGKYHVTSKCTHQTEVVWIHKAHFERLFRKRNPQCIKEMVETVALQVNRRTAREGLLTRAPFFRCLLLKLQELNGERVKPKDDNPSNLPNVNVERSNTVIRQRSSSEMGHRSPELLRRSLRRKAAKSETMPLRSHAMPLRSHAMPLRSHAMPSINQPFFSTTASCPGASQSNSEMAIIERPLSNPREGIFVKLLHVSNPEVTPSHLAIDEEEFEYLIQLRRRIAKEFQDFSIAEKTPYSESREGGIDRPCRSSGRATTRQIARKMFPVLLNDKSGSPASVTKQSNVRLPQF